ncbi:phosphoribosylamine--glycine ligase, partial [Mycobacterium tuberculosis]
LVVLGPAVPFVLGVAAAVRAAGLVCFGPGPAAARLAGSPAFAPAVLAAAGVRPAPRALVARPAPLAAAL